jgi:hypothetical protein
MQVGSDRPKLVLIGLTVLLLLYSLFFPLSAGAGLALLLLVALVGAILAQASRQLRLNLPSWAWSAIVGLVTVLFALGLFAGTWNAAGWRIHDWGPHHANLKHLVDGLRQGHVPVWVGSVSTGDSPYELYPLLPYYLAAKAAIWSNARDLTLVLVRTAIVGHTLAALGASLLAIRIVRWPWAIVVGFATLYDGGSAWGGGVDGLLSLGVLHSALANAVLPFLLMAVLSAIEKPRWWNAVGIWLLVVLAIACHPLGVVMGLATAGALLMVALLAQDISPLRALAAFAHVVLGVFLAAFIWMPLSQRLLLYGVHFGLPGMLAWQGFGHLLAQSIPEATVAPLIYAGYVGVLVGACSRRAGPTLLACFAGIVMAGLFDSLWVLLQLAPSLETARFQTVRLAAPAKISLFVCGAYLLDVVLRTALPKRPDGTGRPAWIMAAIFALVALVAFGLLRGGLPYFDRLSTELRGLSNQVVPDRAGFAALVQWAQEQKQVMRPERYGRLLHQSDDKEYWIYHLNAESGLPTLWVGAVPDLFLRERIADTSPESLRRFNVRWVTQADRPPSLGDPNTEHRFGRYIVRELADWDGRFARVERGEGAAVVDRLEDERIEVDVRDTATPALVALGMGYYPRWQAHRQNGEALPVYAMPATPGGKLHVLAACLPPGRTVFTPTGALPSDGKGRWWSALAAFLALGITVAWPRLPKEAILSRASRAASFGKRHRLWLGLAASGAFVCVLFASSLISLRKAADALRVGNALWPAASVEARAPGENWKACNYNPFYGAYRCEGPVLIQDTVASLLNDAPPSWPFVVPAIHIAASAQVTDVRVRLAARLEGEYWAETNGAEVTLAVSGHPDVRLSAQQSRLAFPASPEPKSITLSATVRPEQPLDIALVRPDRLDPQRNYPLAPDLCPAR